MPPTRREREDEPLAASILVDSQAGLRLYLYERQVEEASRQLQGFVDAVVAKATINDRLFEHSRVIGAAGETSPASIFECNEITINILDGAILIVDNPIDYESYILSGPLKKPEIMGSSRKRRGEYVRFDSVKLRAVEDGMEMAPEMEIIECVPVGPDRPSMNVYNSLSFDPRQQRIAFLEVDTPQINWS